MSFILCDNREHDVYDYLQGKGVGVIKKVIKAGDFNIKFQGSMAMIIERKTWDDLAKSITDGRAKSQIRNMVENRDEYKCKLLFIIEGPKPFKGDNVDICGVEYKSLKSKLRRLIIRHNIPHILTKDHEDTANTIINFAKDYEHIYKTEEGVKGIEKGIGGRQVDDKELFGVRTKCDEELIRNIWCSLNGVSRDSAHVYANRISLRELVRINVNDLANFTYDSGRRVGIKKAEKILETTKNQPLKVVSSLPGIGKKKAELLLNGTCLAELFNLSRDEFVSHCKEKKLSIGEKKTETIFKYLDMKLVVEEKVSFANPLLDLISESKEEKTKELMNRIVEGDLKVLTWVRNCFDNMNSPKTPIPENKPVENISDTTTNT